MSERRDTCIFKRCAFWRRYKDACPNYVEGNWITFDGHTYATKDCAPKRSMILCQQIYDHMIDVRRDYGNVRAANEKLIQVIQHNHPDVQIESADAQLIIEDTTDGQDPVK